MIKYISKKQGWACGLRLNRNRNRKEKNHNRTHGTAKFSTARTEPQNSQPQARNRKILNRTHGTAKISTARTEPHFSRFNHNRKNTNSEK